MRSLKLNEKGTLHHYRKYTFFASYFSTYRMGCHIWVLGMVVPSETMFYKVKKKNGK